MSTPFRAGPGAAAFPLRVFQFWVLLALLGASAFTPAQLPTDDPIEAQKKWYERARERPDLIPGAFEVLRFPTGYTFKPKYRHDRKSKKLILNPDFYCNRCAKEKRIAKAGDRSSKRLMERDEPQVLNWIAAETKSRQYIFIEGPLFKLYFDLPGINMKEFRNPFLKEELRELGDIFPKVSEKTARINRHHRAHLYLIRAHRTLRDLLWMVGQPDVAAIRKEYKWLGPYLGMNAKPELFVFDRQRVYSRFAKRFIGRAAADGQNWHLFRDRAMIMAMPANNQADPQTANYFAHRVLHNLIDSYRMYSFKMPAWFQMGMAHWIERRETVRYNSFCYSEGVLPKVLFETRWAPKVKKLVNKDRVLPFVQAAAAKEYGQLPPEYHMITHSWVCYLWRLGPSRMSVFINEIKAKKPNETLYQAQVRAFRKAYNINMNQFDAGWRKWVKRVYPDM